MKQANLHCIQWGSHEPIRVKFGMLGFFIIIGFTKYGQENVEMQKWKFDDVTLRVEMSFWKSHSTGFAALNSARSGEQSSKGVWLNYWAEL